MSFVRTTYGRPTDLVLADYDKIDPLLISLLRLCTPHGHEHHIVTIIKSQKFLREQASQIYTDKALHNFIVQVGKPEDSSTVFSCHMDIIGYNSDGNTKNNKVDLIHLMTPEDNPKNFLNQGFLYGAKPHKNSKGEVSLDASTLGADDKVGVYILLKMIEKGIPGLYLFHTGEEKGGLGSASLASKHKKMFKGISRAIAFDRANYGDIIAFQRGKRCCSKEFGEAFAEKLNVYMPPRQKFSNDIEGTFTDTASYMELIPECTNISVGYFNQHGNTEHMDYLWLKDILLPCLLKIDYESLPTKRDPKIIEHKSWSNGSSWSYPKGNHQGSTFKDNTLRVAWKDATDKTPYLQFPEWEPKMGMISEADPKVFKMAVEHYVRKATYGIERDALIDSYIFNMGYCELLEEENQVLKKQLGAIPVQSSNIVPVNSNSNGAETLEINVIIKRQYLYSLIEIAPEAVLVDDCDKRLKGLLLGAKQWFHTLSDKNKIIYTYKEVLKINRLILNMACLIDASQRLSPSAQTILLELDEYIVDHIQEPGFDLYGTINPLHTTEHHMNDSTIN